VLMYARITSKEESIASEETLSSTPSFKLLPVIASKEIATSVEESYLSL